MQRDFTYVDDVVEATVRVLNNPPSEEIPYRIYNVGHSSPLDLMDFIHLLEKCAGKTVKKEYKGMQQGDVLATYADTHLLENDIPPVMERKTGIVPKGLINVKNEVKQSSAKGSTDSICFYFSFINF